MIPGISLHSRNWRPGGRQPRTTSSPVLIAVRRTGLVFVWGALLALAAPGLQAQVSLSGRPCPATSAYRVVDRSTGREVGRGYTTPSGALADGLVLGPNREYDLVFANGAAGTIGATRVRTGPSGSTVELPPVDMGTSIAPDSDRDGVPDDIEDLYGLDASNPNSLGAGIPDAMVVLTPPPPGTPGAVPPGGSLPAPGSGPGPIASVNPGGVCVDIHAANGILALACLQDGVPIFDVTGGLFPRLIAVVDTPGTARAVAVTSGQIAVADGAAGLALIDLGQPADAAIRFQVPLGSEARAVAAGEDRVHVGLRNGQVVTVEPSTGAEIGRVATGAEVFDLTVASGLVWVVSGNQLIVYSTPPPDDEAVTRAGGVPALVETGRVPLSAQSADTLSGRKRVFVGGNRAMVTCRIGFDLIDVTNPSAMVRTGAPRTGVPGGPGSVKHGVFNGGGLGFVGLGVNAVPNDPHDVSLYDLADPSNTGNLIGTLRTPGIAYANIVYNGLLYIADGASGLQVQRYSAVDRAGLAPAGTLAIDTDLPFAGPALAAPGSAIPRGTSEAFARLAVVARDDFEVRNVEFHRDGQLVVSDGSFPFEAALRLPTSGPGRDTTVFRARVFDTGGNSSWTEPVTVRIVPRTRGPRVIGTQPSPGGIASSGRPVLVEFDVALLPGSVGPAALRVTLHGPDRVPNTSDDVPVPGVNAGLSADGRTLRMVLPADLPRGGARLVLDRPLADRSGNVMEDAFDLVFNLLGQPDRDGDGIPDDLEPALGLDPDSPVSGTDPTPDGRRDPDNDGLWTAFEILHGLDPTRPRSVDAAILDGDLDTDGDALSHRLEQGLGTNPTLADTDGDGWNDETEKTSGSDPLRSRSRPRPLHGGGPAAWLVRPDPAPARAGGMVSVASVPVSLVLPDARLNRTAPFVAQPPVLLRKP